MFCHAKRIFGEEVEEEAEQECEDGEDGSDCAMDVVSELGTAVEEAVACMMMTRMSDDIYACKGLSFDGRQAEIKKQRIAKCSLQRGVPHPFMCPLERGTKNSKNASFAFCVGLVMQR